MSTLIRSICTSVFGVLLVQLGGCGGTRTAASPARPAASTPLALVAAASPVVDSNWDHSAAKVPVTWEDPSWGRPDAPVTIVEFTDYDCPFCARVSTTLDHIQQKYGPTKVRIVTLHNPLPFHRQAYPAAIAATAAFQLAGQHAFSQFTALAFELQSELSDENYVVWATACGIDEQAFRKALAGGRAKRKVDADIALAEQLGVAEAPGFRINGVMLMGAQPLEKFTAIIDEQLLEAAKLIKSGNSPKDVYVTLTNRNVGDLIPEAGPDASDATSSAPPGGDSTIYEVPVLADDPVLGPVNALVTVVIFCDFQSPFCKRVEPTLKQVRKHFGVDMRIVWKDQPLPFHPQAMPAAILGRLVYTEKGDKAFWSLHDEMFAAQPDIGNEKLKALASKFGVSWAKVESELKRGRIKDRIDASSKLATDLRAFGAPHFFINGIRLVGAPPFEKFQAYIDAQLRLAKAIQAAIDTELNVAKVRREAQLEGAKAHKAASAALMLAKASKAMADAKSKPAKATATQDAPLDARVLEATREAASAGTPANAIRHSTEGLAQTGPESIPAPQTPTDVKAPPSNAKKTASGLAYVVLRRGTGIVHPKANSRVAVHYSGWTTDGKMFDSSITRGDPVKFGLQQVIPGWTEGVQLMVVGEKTRFWIPAQLAYGENPTRPGAPSGMLVFDIELLGIE